MHNFVTMKIEVYISQLLYRYQCVTVPGFGAFLTETHSAQLNESTNSFFPPKKTISFNSRIKNNDGLLANHVALQEKISYEEAVKSIQNEVALWAEQLQRKEVVTLKNIGTIAVNAEWNWVFEPVASVNYLADAFGLSAVVSPAVQREVLKAQVEALIKAHRATAFNKVERLAMHEELQKVLQSDSFDEAGVRVVLEKQQAKRLEMEVAQLKFQHQLRAVLTPEQQAKLDERKAKMRHKMREKAETTE